MREGLLTSHSNHSAAFSRRRVRAAKRRKRAGQANRRLAWFQNYGRAIDVIAADELDQPDAGRISNRNPHTGSGDWPISGAERKVHCRPLVYKSSAGTIDASVFRVSRAALGRSRFLLESQ